MTDTLPYQQFGLWREYSDKYLHYPSVYDFVDSHKNSMYDIPRLKHYLDNGEVIAASSRMAFPNPFTKKLTGGSICFRTDGKWLWLDDLSDYIEHNALVIPDQWYREIELRDFVVPKVTEDQKKKFRFAV